MTSFEIGGYSRGELLLMLAARLKPAPFQNLFRFRCSCFHVAAEFLAHGGEHFLGERVCLARTKTDEERRRQNLRGDGFFECGLNRPATFAGILHEAFVFRERGIFRQRHRREIETAKDQALLEIWNQSTQLAAMLSAKTIKREIRPEDHAKLFDESLKEMKAAAAGKAGNS